MVIPRLEEIGEELISLRSSLICSDTDQVTVSLERLSHLAPFGEHFDTDLLTRKKLERLGDWARDSIDLQNSVIDLVSQGELLAIYQKAGEFLKYFARWIAPEPSPEDHEESPAATKRRPAGRKRVWEELDSIIKDKSPDLNPDKDTKSKIAAEYNQKFGNKAGHKLANVEQVDLRLKELRRPPRSKGNNGKSAN